MFSRVMLKRGLSPPHLRTKLMRRFPDDPDGSSSSPKTRTRWPRVILHVDMDAFYASVEVRERPALVSRPVIVGGGSGRGVVTTCNYVARRFGVRSAMPGFQARRLCPKGVFLKPRMALYASVSRELMEIFRSFSPLVEPLSLDEAFIDMSDAQHLFESPLHMAQALREAIWQRLQLTASVGVAPNKFIAKVASDLNKPDGVTLCRPGSERSFLASLDVRKIWGVGPRSAEVLHGMGLSTMGAVADWPVASLQKRLGSAGFRIWQCAQGIDERAVVSSRKRKSVGSETTLAANVEGASAILPHLRAQAEEVARVLRSKEWFAVGVRVKLKYADFQSVSRERRLLAPSDETEVIVGAAIELLRSLDTSRPVRLVGVAASQLRRLSEGVQQPLNIWSPTPRRVGLGRTLDAIDARWGSGSIMRVEGKQEAADLAGDS